MSDTLSIRELLCVKLLSIKKAFMGNTPISSGTFMRNSAPLSVRENLSVSPQANRFQHSPSPFGEGVGGVRLLSPPCHFPKHLAVEVAFSL